jgi:hypothetical protein
LKLHRRQFLIGPAPVLVDEEWTSIDVGDGMHLSFERALPITPVRDRDRGAWYLLGRAVQSDPTRAAPPDEIAAARTAEVDLLTSTWSGRWVLVGDGAVHPDAAGLLGCFYAGDSRDCSLVVSSSAALLREQVDPGTASPPLRYRVGMGWYPPPASRFKGIRRLLPSQALTLDGAGDPVRHRPLLVDQPKAGYDETLAQLETSLRTVLRNLAKTGRPLWLALTGGYDSRLLLAAMRREGLEFTTFTWETSILTKADRTIPPLLAKDVRVRHRFLTRRRFHEERLRIFDEHTAFHTADLDRELIPWGQYEELPPDAIVILGNVIPLGSLHFYGRLTAHLDVVESVAEGYGFAEHHRDSPAHWDGIRKWADWIHAHPERGMDWRDRFYWEQLVAGWCSSCEQATDFVDVECASPAACQSIMAEELSIDPAKRYNKRWQVDLTYRMAPSLTDHPYHLGGPFLNRLRRVASGLIHHPRKRRFATGRVRSLAGRLGPTAPGSTI